MKPPETHQQDSGLPLSTSALFGFLWDFRERQVNQASFWYGFFQTLAMVWALRWIWEGTGFEWWRVPLVIMACIAAKWCQSRHALKSDPNNSFTPENGG